MTRVAHFSDVHAFTTEGAHVWQWLGKRTAGYANMLLHRKQRHPVALFEALVDDLNRRDVDEVVITGDLTNLSLGGELSLARGIVDRLRLGAAHVTVVPGNHDVYTLDAWLGHDFQQAFAPYMTSDDGATDLPLLRRRGALAILGASSARPSPVPFADGSLGARQRQRLASLLHDTRDSFRLLLMHHPPVDNRHVLLRGLRDRVALQALLGEHGCGLVVHGHEHRDVRATIASRHGDIPVVGVGSGTYDDPRPERRARYNVYVIEDRALINTETWIHDPASNTFRLAH